MAQGTNHIPSGMPAVIPQLIVKDATQLIAFATKAFGAQHMHSMPNPDGKGVMHGMITIGGAPIFVSDASNFAQPTAANVFVYVPDVDAAFARAVEAGGKAVAPVTDMFWGDRWGLLADPFGNLWQVATHKEDVSPEEMQRRMKGMR